MCRNNWKTVGAFAGMIAMALLAGCGTADTYEDFVFPKQQESTLQPIDDFYIESDYTGEEAKVENALKTFVSEDGLCRIDKKEDYFEVWLFYDQGSYAEVGRAYAKTALLAEPQMEQVMEPYLYENIKLAFPDLEGDYTPIADRMNTLKESLPSEYLEEMEAFAGEASKGVTGFCQDGILSYEEACLMHMIPDALRGTNCSAFSLWGDKSMDGNMITGRILEWNLGSERQMCRNHCVVHMQYEDRSLTGFCVLGMLDVLTAVNDRGVFAGILDVGSGDEYVYDGKKCYTYELRYALEHFDTARQVGEYMVANSGDFTFSHNLILSDGKECFAAEICVDPTAGKALLRDTDTPLHAGLQWDSADSLCVINTYQAAENRDELTDLVNEIVRFQKYNRWMNQKEKLTLTDVKNMLTSEAGNDVVVNVRSDNVFQIILIDYANENVQAVFTGVEGVQEHPVFINIGSYKNRK